MPIPVPSPVPPSTGPGVRGETVTRLRPSLTGETDRYNNVIDGPPDELDITGCAIEPVTSTESAESQLGEALTTLKVYAPPNTDIERNDVLRIRGEDGWQVIGRAQRWISPYTGYEFGVVATVQKVDG